VNVLTHIFLKKFWASLHKHNRRHCQCVEAYHQKKHRNQLPSQIKELKQSLFKKQHLFSHNPRGKGSLLEFSIFSFPLHRPTIAARKSPVNRTGSMQRGSSVLGCSPVADGINLQRLLQWMPQRHLVGFTARVIVFQPPAIMIRRYDDRHPVMQRCNGRVRRPRMMVNDSIVSLAGASSRSVSNLPTQRLDPPVPQTGKAKRLAAFQHHPERLPFAVPFLPLVKTVRRNQAPPILNASRTAVRLSIVSDRALISAFRRFILCPGGITPIASAHRRLIVIMENDRRELCRRDIVNAAQKTAPAP